MTIRIGTSGWVYDHWRGVFYPEGLPQRDWLGYYAREFDTAEINNTFYRLPGETAFSTEYGNNGCAPTLPSLGAG
jgi:uncharacterized protein YecE (DUF72 family)